MIRASAPGKVNLYFAVGRKMPNGYHEVCSVYLALDLREVVGVDFSDELTISVGGDLSDQQLSGVPTDSKNLVVAAAKLITDKTISFDITKRVPVAGGMGGGSADAAAALLATQTLTGAEPSADVVALGADVPFALMGGAALGVGVGEQLTPLEMTCELNVVLIANAGGLSTPAVYKRLDELRAEENLVPEFTPTIPHELIEALRAGNVETIASLAHNDLQRAALDLNPQLQETIDLAKAAGALTALVSGSGPTVFAIADTFEAAGRIAKQFGSAALVTTGPAAGARLES